jgi:hypothetical protein
VVPAVSSEGFENLKKLYFFLDENFDNLFGECTTDDQRQQLRHDYVVARDCFCKARNLIFQDDDPMVQALNKQLQGAQKEMEAELAGSKEITKILSFATDAVNLAGRLLALGAIV